MDESTSEYPQGGAIIWTNEALDKVFAEANAPGQHRRAILLLSRVIGGRLFANGEPLRLPARCVYGDADKYLLLESSSMHRATASVGIRLRGGGLSACASMTVLWDGLGVAGPFNATIKGREGGVGEFCAVLAKYLHFPRIAGPL